MYVQENMYKPDIHLFINLKNPQFGENTLSTKETIICFITRQGELDGAHISPCSVTCYSALTTHELRHLLGITTELLGKSVQFL